MPLPPGPARLEIVFNGEILERLRGFYRSQKDGARYAATQFEAADARRAFPCFDEPEFKARFALTLVVPPGVTADRQRAATRETRTLGGGRKRVRFAETPPISSYLVAYCVGPFEATPVATTPSGVPVRVLLPRGLADKGLYARDAHVALARATSKTTPRSPTPTPRSTRSACPTSKPARWRTRAPSPIA